MGPMGPKLGFKRFSGRGLRYVVEWRGKWLELAGWQSGAFPALGSWALGRMLRRLGDDWQAH